jgi:hypothetical protein
MATISPLLDGWRAKGASPSEALERAPVDEATLVDDLAAGVNRRDSDGVAIPGLGFRWAAWNGRMTAAAAVSVTCGATTTGVGVLNSFVVDLPPLPTDGAASIYSAAESLVLGVVEAWNPDWAVVTSNELRSARRWEPAQPVVGWLTYLGPTRRPGGGVGSACSEGTLIAAVEDWASVEVENVERLARVLDEAGVRHPTG